MKLIPDHSCELEFHNGDAEDFLKHPVCVWTTNPPLGGYNHTVCRLAFPLPGPRGVNAAPPQTRSGRKPFELNWEEIVYVKPC